MSDAPLPRFVHDLLASPPRRGDGLNLWLFRVARVLHPFRTATEIVSTLTAATAGEPVTTGEIERAVERSATVAWKPGEKQAPCRGQTWPAVNRDRREAILASGGGLADLWEASPVRFDDDGTHTEEIIDCLFPGNPLLCVAKSNREFETASREELRGTLAGLSLIVPSPMTARMGRTQDGKE